MVSPELQNYRAKLRLRDTADPFDCLDLSIQSSSLLSASLQPQFDGSDDENAFPFQVSPTESYSRTAVHNNTGSRAHLHSKVQTTKLKIDAASDPLSPLTNVESSSAQKSSCAVNLPAPLTPPVGQQIGQHEMHPEPEQTPSVLSSKFHQSPSRQQKPADPRRESTVLFKGFSASTAETGLLEVNEIAEINGSPELMRVSHNSVSVTTPETPNPPAAPQSNAASGFQQPTKAVHNLGHNNHPAVFSDTGSSSNAGVEITYHQQPDSSSHACLALAPDAEHSFELRAQQEDSIQSQSTTAGAEPSLGAAPDVKLQDPVAAASAAAALALQSRAGNSQPAGVNGMRRSVGMRDSMCFFLQLEGAVEGQNGFEPEEVLKLDEVRRQSGGKASLPAVPEEEDEGLSQSSADAPHQQLPSDSSMSYSQHEAEQPIATQQQQHSQQSWSPNGRALHVKEARATRTMSSMQNQADMLDQSDNFDLMPAHIVGTQQHHNAKSQAASNQRHWDVTQSQASEMQSLRHQGQMSRPESHGQEFVSAQQPLQQHLPRQDPPPRSQAGQSFQTSDRAPVQQPAVISPAKAAANKPVPSRAATKVQTSPIMAHVVEPSSLSLSELAGVSKSKLRGPSSLNSPPKRASRVKMPKQATNSHLVKLAAAVPLPASPDGAGKLALEPTAAAALATAVAKPSHIPAPAVKASRLKKPTNTSGFFSSGRSFTGGASNSRPDFSQNLMSTAAASKTAVPAAAAAGPPSLARVSAPAVRAPRTAFPGPSATGPSATTGRLAASTAQGCSSTGLNSSGAPNLARPSASGPLGAAAMYSTDAAPQQGHLQQPDLARASMPVQNRQGSSQLPPSGAPAKSGKSKGVMASMLGSVKKAVGIKSRTKDLQSDDGKSPSAKPERSAMSSMGFTRSQPSQSRLPSFTALRSKASNSSSNAQAQTHTQPQRSGASFTKKGHTSFTREATPPLPSEVEELLRNEEMAFQGRGGGVGNSPADRAAKEASLRQSAQERHWQDYAASIH